MNYWFCFLGFWFPWNWPFPAWYGCSLYWTFWAPPLPCLLLVPSVEPPPPPPDGWGVQFGKKTEISARRTASWGWWNVYCLHLVDHLLSFFGKLRAKKEGCRLLKICIISDDWEEGFVEVAYNPLSPEATNSTADLTAWITSF